MRTLSSEELAREANVSDERIGWLASIGIIKPRDPGPYRWPDVFRVKLVAALLDAGFERDVIAKAARDGFLTFQHIDDFGLREPAARSDRSFDAFLSAAGPRASMLPAVYEILGLPKPSPAEHLHADEEEMFQRFLEGWRDAPSEETLLRAARLIAEATRVIAIGWADLLDEEIARPAREKVLRGETDRFPREVAQTIAKLVGLAPRMVEWLTDRYLEQRSTAGIVEGFERFLASRNILPPPAPAAEPAVVFVDVSGYTRLTEERGDEAAVLVAGRLQRAADAAAAANGGRLVKLLGDGAMLRFPDAERGVAAALGLVRDLDDSAGLTAHAGVHAGPVIVRDLDLYGRTVNLASRITGAAGPGEVLVSEAVAQAAGDGAIRFEPADTAALKGISDPVTLYRALPR